MDLIETYWDVKECLAYAEKINAKDLIETYWDVKSHHAYAIL